jgi:hypothetical protein
MNDMSFDSSTSANEPSGNSNNGGSTAGYGDSGGGSGGVDFGGLALAGAGAVAGIAAILEGSVFSGSIAAAAALGFSVNQLAQTVGLGLSTDPTVAVAQLAALTQPYSAPTYWDGGGGAGNN